MSKNRIITHKIKRGSLIHFALDGIKRESFEVIKTELASLLKKRAGVYALYQNDKLVRVGLGTNIYWRLKGHSKSRKLVWNTASLFIIGPENLSSSVNWKQRFFGSPSPSTTISEAVFVMSISWKGF